MSMKCLKVYVLTAIIMGLLFNYTMAGDHEGQSGTGYFKQSQGQWFKVTWENDQIIHNEACMPPSPAVSNQEMPTLSSSSTTQGFYEPFQLFDVGSWPEAVAIGDVNNDGLNDVVMTTSSYSDPENDHRLFVFLQATDGTLNTPIKYSLDPNGRAVSVAIGDINADGLKDVLVGNRGRNLEVLCQNASGTLNASVYYNSTNTSSIKPGDYNGDGLLDVAGIGWGTNTVSVWLQNASGTLNTPVTYSVTHGGYDELESGDVNHDGLTDLVIMSGQLYSCPNIGVLLQNPAGGFLSAVYYDLGGNELTSGVAVGDITNDNRADIVVSYGGNRPYAFIGVFAQNASGTLNPALNYSAYDCPQPVEIGDADSDFRQDVYTIHGGWNNLSIYRQDETGNLQPYQSYPLPYASSYNPQGLAVGDINNDQEIDVVVADYNNGLVVLYHKPVPFVGVVAAPAAVAETGANPVFQFTRSAINLDQPLTVSFTISGSALPGSDYQAITQTVTFEAGVSTVQVPVVIIDDTIAECNENIQITLVDSPAYNLMPESSASLTILENDQNVVRITVPIPNAKEKPITQGRFIFYRTGNLSQSLTVPLLISGTAVNGVDYNRIISSITFGVNVSSVSLYIRPIKDNIVEGSESVIFELLDSSCTYSLDPQAYRGTIWIADK